MRRQLVAITVLTGALFHSATAVRAAENQPVSSAFENWLDQGSISGAIRAYDFDRLYGSPDVPNQSAFSLAGILNLQSAPFMNGFEVGTSLFTATALGLNDRTGTAPSFPRLDATLMGPNNDLTALGQAYVQYQKPWLLVRVGDQELDTPWVGESDSRALPATYQAVFGEVSPVKSLELFGFRQLAWKSRTSSTYFQDNLYYPAIFDGDTSYGGTAALSSDVRKARGTLAAGASYGTKSLKAEASYYDFYDFANMFYTDANYTLPTGGAVLPFLAGQFLREWDADSYLNADRFGTAIDGVKGNGVDATAFGAQLGLKYTLGSPIFGAGLLALSYNALLVHQGSVGGGAIVSPYTIGYATDPLYTTALIRGLVELGPGDAKRVALTQHMFGDHILATVAFSRFDTKLSGGSNDTYADLTYFPGGTLIGLSIRDRMEVSNASFQFNNGATGNRGHSFVYNRLMLQYTF
jgi:hypothetical protein